MATLQRASQELFRRRPDECFPTLEAIREHCRRERQESQDRWHLPGSLQPLAQAGELQFAAGNDGAFLPTDWSFSQICRLSGVDKDTVNRLTAETAAAVFRETLPQSKKPVQLLTTNGGLRSLHGTAYTRLWNAELLECLADYASDFTPPQTGVAGGSGLYCGEQDMFCFLIDPQGWIDIGGEAFAPGFFVWNSEVGRRSLGISTFWFQKVCANHIVWDATEVVEFSRKHIGQVREGLEGIAQHIEALTKRRDERRDAFAATITKAMTESMGDTAEATLQALTKQAIPRASVAKAVQELGTTGKPFTLWNLIEALTRFHTSVRYAGDRADKDQLVGKLLALVA